MAVDERLRRALEEAGRPADPSGVYEHLIRRRERRRFARRVRTAGLAVLVVAGSIAGYVGLTKTFDSGNETPTIDPAPVPIEPHANGVIAYSLSTPGGMELRSILPDGSGDAIIPTPDGLPWLHAWSPDGSAIAVSVFPSGGGDREIWVMNADGSDAHRIAAAENVSAPSWTPDGASIVYASDTGPTTEIHVVQPDGSNDRTIHVEDSKGTRAIFSATVSPDGGRILFDRGTDVGFDIFVMDVDGSNVERLTTTGADYDPHWSPDGLRIAFTRQGEGAQSDIYVMDADGSNVRRLTAGGAGTTNLYPQWSPDGTSIVYVAGVTGGPGPVIVMAADGSAPRTLLDGEVLGISWQPLPVEPSPSAEQSPTESPPSSEDIGLGFPVCDVTSVGGRFAAGIDGTAFVATRMGDTGGCPPPDDATQVLAVDIDGDGLADTSYGPLECDQWCNAFAAPDVDGDGADELLIQNVQFSIRGLKLFDVQTEHAGGRIVPVTVLPPGTPAFGYRGFEGDTEPQLWLGGDAGNADAIRCEPYQGGRAFVSVTSSHPIEGADHIDVTETTFVLEIDRLRVVDVQEFDWPIDDDAPPFLHTGGCGASLPYP